LVDSMALARNGNPVVGVMTTALISFAPSASVLCLA